MSNTEYREGFAGGCFKDGKEICVHRDESYCDAGSWATAHYLRGNPGHHLRFCAYELQNVVIGRCGESGPCSNLAERCKDEVSFIPYDPTCTVTLELTDFNPVKYGKCGDRCVWSSEDCGTGETFVQRDQECTSDKVEVGSCWAGSAFCAISKDSCSQEGQPVEPFLTHSETKEQIGISCYLSLVPDAPPPPSAAPKLNIALAPTPETSIRVPQSNRESSGMSTEAIAAIVAGLAILTGSLMGLVAYRMGVLSFTGGQKTDVTDEKPMASVEAVEHVIDDSEELSVQSDTW